MNSRENLRSEEVPVSEEQEKKAAVAVKLFIDPIVKKSESAGEAEEAEIKQFYDKLSTREKADVLYGKMMAFHADRKAELAQRREGKAEKGKSLKATVKADPYLVSEIKVLTEDPEVMKLFSLTFSEARMDASEFGSSDLADIWNKTNGEFAQKEGIYKDLERQVYLNEIDGRTSESSAKSRMAILANNLTSLEKRKASIESLTGYPATPENTDMVANFQYRNLEEYARQLKSEGFVWLPSRKEIHKRTVSALENHRWPVLIGEAGSGKSEQANAAALELTGNLPTEIECESVTGETQLIKDVAIDSVNGGSYEEYGPLMRAYTGFDDSRQQVPTVTTGRIARFDESGRLGPKAYSIIKKTRQKNAGDDYYGHPVLPGSGAVWTSNPVGPRYPDRHAPDPAMRRELAEIHVDYPEMDAKNPELYEFALVSLFDENNHINAPAQEISPFYEKIEIPEGERQTLEDGSIVVARQELVQDTADLRHGSLWRFAGAIKALQNSFVYGNGDTEKYPDDILRFKEGADGSIEVTPDGEVLTLSTSTVTLGELSSWMTGFNERRQKQDRDFRVDTLTEWLNFKINTYLKQADKSDGEKLKAIFQHFGFLDKTPRQPNLGEAKPLTPKAIGYLSPRTPRPLFLERPVAPQGEEVKEKPAETGELKEYDARQVLLENGERALVKPSEFVLGKDTIKPGRKARLKLDGEDFSYAGVVEDQTNSHNGQPVVKLANEELYRILSPAELDMGIFIYESQENIIKGVPAMREAVESYIKP